MNDHEYLLLNGYYIDFDHFGQLRIAGPGNHLYFGAISPDTIHLQVHSAIARSDTEITLKLKLQLTQDFFPDPVMGHIRRVRDYTQVFGHPCPTYADIVLRHPGELAPNTITSETIDNHTTVVYLRTFGEYYYGTTLTWPESVELRRDNNRHGYYISNPSISADTVLTLQTISNIGPISLPYSGTILKNDLIAPHHLPQPLRTQTQKILQKTAAEIDHLIRYHKTSGFDYGTVFPRDWMETADLLAEDLAPSALHHLYTQSLKHVNDKGVGWHEDIIGEYKYEREQEIRHLSQAFESFVGPNHPLNPHFQRFLTDLDELFVTRRMIDIEPRYLLSLRLIPFSEFDPHSQKHLRQIARYIVNQAEQQDLITFNKLAKPFKRQRGDEYYDAGNWRDSTLAFRQVHPVIAPFDVNVVFYPQALRIAHQHHQSLELDPIRVERIIAKWSNVRNYYRFTNPDGKPAFALALYNVRHQDHQLRYEILRVNHLDEASELFYGQPTQSEVVSFAERLLSPQYFYTPSGPILVGRGEGYDHSQYHGEVIWAKQAAYAVAGLEYQMRVGQTKNWSKTTMTLLQQACITTAETCLNAFTTLGSVPELHYDDYGHARFYTDQPAPEGLMNKVQLWSAAGAHRLIRTYLHQIAR